MERIAILKVNGFLLVTIQVEMQDDIVLRLQDDLTQMLARTGATGVLIDISGLEIVDSFIGRSLANTAAVARMMNAVTVVAGMKPAVAITMVELGMSLEGVRTAVSVDKAMVMLREAAAHAAR
jgi:rsbT antagonist protein RsbS